MHMLHPYVLMEFICAKLHFILFYFCGLSYLTSIWNMFYYSRLGTIRNEIYMWSFSTLYQIWDMGKFSCFWWWVYSPYDLHAPSFFKIIIIIINVIFFMPHLPLIFGFLVPCVPPSKDWNLIQPCQVFHNRACQKFKTWPFGQLKVEGVRNFQWWNAWYDWFFNFLPNVD